MKRLAEIVLLCFLIINAYSQDSVKTKIKSDTIPKKQEIILSKLTYRLIENINPDTVSRNTILWLPLKSIEQLFQYLPGFYLKYMDIGQVNPLTYNQLDAKFIALIKNDRLMNDLLDGLPDLNLISANEIDVIETNGFGSSQYKYPVSVNVIERQIYRNRPFTEISYTLDRYEHNYLNGNFHKNFFGKFNFNFGITKHSYDGKYINSDFDKWQGRFHLNYIGSKIFNSFLYVNYTKIQRGLNGGLDPLKNNINNNDSLMNSIAVVRNPDAYEIRTRFDIDLGVIFKTSKKKDDYLKLQLFTSNMFREYRDEENRPTPNGILIKDNSHWIDYGAKLNLVYGFNITKSLKITSTTETEYNKDLIKTNLFSLNRSERIFLKQSVTGDAGMFKLNVYAKTARFKYISDEFYNEYGIKPMLVINTKDSAGFILYGEYHHVYKLPSYNDYFLHGPASRVKFDILKGSIKLKKSFLEVLAEYYFKFNIVNNGIILFGNSTPENKNNNGFNFNLKADLFNININANLNINNISSSDFYNTIPKQFGSVIISYRNYFFNKKLDLKVGLNTRFWGDYFASFYNGFYNSFNDQIYDSTASRYINIKVDRDFTLDFFIIAKIDKANFGLAFENLLDRISYSTSIYPNIDRGGLFRFISRFWITWYFFD
jgi:hypothetical protein